MEDSDLDHAVRVSSAQFDDVGVETEVAKTQRNAVDTEKDADLGPVGEIVDHTVSLHTSKNDSSPEPLRHRDSSASEENDLTESGKEDQDRRSADQSKELEEPTGSGDSQHLQQHEGTESSQEDPAVSSLRDRSEDDVDSDLGGKIVPAGGGGGGNSEIIDSSTTMNSSYEQVSGMEDLSQSNHNNSFGGRDERQAPENRRRSREEEEVDADLPESERHVVMDPGYRTSSQQTMVQSAGARSNAVVGSRSGFDGLTSSLGESLPRIPNESRGYGSNPTMMDASESPSIHRHRQSQIHDSPMSCGYPDDRQMSPQAAPLSRDFPGRISGAPAVSPATSAPGVSMIPPAESIVRGRSCSPQISGGRRMFNAAAADVSADGAGAEGGAHFPDASFDPVGCRLAASKSSDSIQNSAQDKKVAVGMSLDSSVEESASGAAPPSQIFVPSPTLSQREETATIASAAAASFKTSRGTSSAFRPPHAQPRSGSHDVETQAIPRDHVQRPADLNGDISQPSKSQQRSPLSQSLRNQAVAHAQQPHHVGQNGFAHDEPQQQMQRRETSVLLEDAPASCPAASEFPWEAMNDAGGKIAATELPRVEEGLSDFSGSESDAGSGHEDDDRDSLAAEGIAFDNHSSARMANAGLGDDPRSRAYDGKDVADSPCYKLPKLRSRSEDQEVSSKAHAYNLNSELSSFRRHCNNNNARQQQHTRGDEHVRQPESYRGAKSASGVGARDNVDRTIADIRSVIRQTGGFKPASAPVQNVSSGGNKSGDPVWVPRVDNSSGRVKREGSERDTTEDEDIETLAAAAAELGTSNVTPSLPRSGAGGGIAGEVVENNVAGFNLSKSDHLQLQQQSNHALNQNQSLSSESSLRPNTFHHTTSGLDLYRQAQMPLGGKDDGEEGGRGESGTATSHAAPLDQQQHPVGSSAKRRFSEEESSSETETLDKGYCDDVETDRLVDNEYRRSTTVEIPEVEQSPLKREQKARIKDMRVKVASPDNPTILIEGVLYGARYLGSTQLSTEGRPSKSLRMMQAQEAIARIKAPQGESQPSTDVELFVSTERILVLNTDLQEIMMDHSLRTISYIADIGDIVVLMARRNRSPSSPSSEDGSGSGGNSAMAADLAAKRQQHKMVCHVFESDEAQDIARAIGQAFQVAYREFLKANGIEDHSFLKEVDYQEVLASQEIFNDELTLFSSDDKQREVVVVKGKGDMVGVVIVESGWGSMLPTVVVANLMPQGAAAKSGLLNIGDQLLAINGVSLVGLPLSTCQSHIKAAKSQTVARFSVVPCAPVVEVRLKRPDVRCPLGFSVQNGIICSILRGGLAERGGVRVGHRIIEINGSSVVAVAHEKIVSVLANSVGEIQMKTMPTSIFRLLTGQETPQYI